jgi:RHS repeat-associated protein
LAERLEYDPWGKRRSVTDSNSMPDTLDGVIDNKGFTNHEMLDQLDLVHMNGRVYDPWTGRFLSGDPLVQDPVNGQSYNRYSYVVNNPTNLTDPTGFCAEGSDGVGSRICGAVNPQAFGNGFNGYAAQASDKLVAQYNQAVVTIKQYIGQQGRTKDGNDSPNVKSGAAASAGSGNSSAAKAVGQVAIDTVDAALTGSYGKRTSEAFAAGDHVGVVTNTVAGAAYGVAQVLLAAEAAVVRTGKLVVGAVDEALTAKGAAEGEKLLFRRGAADTKALLQRDAQAAENALGIHGVSVSTNPAAKAGQVVRCATCSSVEAAGFKVQQTGGNPAHHTVELPKPITPDVVRTWNELFK